MVTAITCYQDSSGKLHTTARDAHRAELAIWLAATGAINEASAHSLAERLAENAEEVASMLAAITKVETGAQTLQVAA